jgi:intracellular multiplication protein IcmO
MAYQRGLSEEHEQKSTQLLRDTRTLGQKLSDVLMMPEAVAVVLVVLAAFIIYIPALFDLLFLFGIGIYIFSITRKYKLPFRMPMRSKMPDYNDPKPGTISEPQAARGIYFFGNDVKTNAEMWFTNDDMRTHVLIFGSTGSGKTEALVSIAYNALIQSSGFIYVDGKGDNSLFAKVFSMVRSMGREDDLLLINFMTGARDIIGPQKKRISNTINPFATGSSSMLTQLVVSLMDSGSGSGDGDMWKGRAIAFVEALMKVLVAMRDANHILLDANSIRNYFELDRLEAMAVDKVFIRDDQEPVGMDFLPDLIMQPMSNYLKTLPGYNRAKKGKQVSQVLEQHGFITMQLTRVFTSLADTYGHIVRVKMAEVDFKDVVLNRRILTVLLPALEKSPDELANLGKVIIASLRTMMAAGLGDAVEGTYRELVTRKPTNAPTPYLCVLDEYGYYAVQGFAVVPAQARSLGFSVIFAGQDLPAFQKASKEEAMSIGANTNIKICMKLEDPLETWDFFMKTAGESFVTAVESFQSDDKSLTGQYADTKTAKVEKRARVDLLDLKDQREGEAHVFFKSKLVRAKMFYANPKPVAAMRLNHYLRVEAPKDRDLYRLAKSFELFEEATLKGLHFVTDAPHSPIIDRIINSANLNKYITPVEAGVNVLVDFQQESLGQVTEQLAARQVGAGFINVFSGLVMTESLSGRSITDNMEQLCSPVLGFDSLREEMQLLERLSGQTDAKATEIGNEIMQDMETITQYPPQHVPAGDPARVLAAISQLLVDLAATEE